MPTDAPEPDFRMESSGSDASHAVICASCGERTEAVPCSACGGSPLLAGRYRLHDRAPARSVGLMYLGTDLRRSSMAVCVRVVPVHREAVPELEQLVPQWTQTLLGPMHPVVRGWLDCVWIGSGAAQALAIVQRKAPSDTLARQLGMPLPASRTTSILEQLLEGMVALHEAAIAISTGPLHPGRVGVGDGGMPVILHPVELDAYAESIASVRAEPPELEHSAWTPAADVYRLGVLGACLLTGCDPIELPASGGWARWVNGADPLVLLLQQWMDPEARHRPSSAREALQALQDLSRPAARTPSLPTVQVPAPSRIVVAPEPAFVSVSHPSGDEFSPGVAAIRIRPLPERAPTPTAPSAPRARNTISPDTRPRVSASASFGGGPARSSDGWLFQAVIATLLVMLAVVGLVTAQISLTATGVLDGSPWIPLGTNRSVAP